MDCADPVLAEAGSETRVDKDLPLVYKARIYQSRLSRTSKTVANNKNI